MSDPKIDTAGTFKRTVVDEDYKDYKSDPHNLRKAYHLALGLFHLRDWTFWQYGAEPAWQYGNSTGLYQTHLETLCKEFGYMRDLANAVKHAELDPKKKPSTQMVGLANTQLISSVFQPGVFQDNAFQMRTVIQSEIDSGKFVDFEPAANAVMTMWDALFSTNGWT